VDLSERFYRGLAGVRYYDRQRAWPGYTLFSPAFGDQALLIDMNGLVIKNWPVVHCQLPELLPNGNLLADNYLAGLMELTWSGEVVWQWEGMCHHDFERLPNGNTIFLLATDEPDERGISTLGELRSDSILEVTPQNEVVWQWHFIDHTEALHDLGRVPFPVTVKDWLHTNTLEVLPPNPSGERDKRFRAGNLLFSCRSQDVIGVVDRDSEEIVWAWGLGYLDGQHQPTMLDNGHILLFDNGTLRGYSRVVELDPLSGDVVWAYEDRETFFSPYRAGVQKLPNDNILVCESDSGRLFELTEDKEIVWEYRTALLGEQGRHIYRATRYGPDFIHPLLEQDDVMIVLEGRHATVKKREAVERYWLSWQ